MKLDRDKLLLGKEQAEEKLYQTKAGLSVLQAFTEGYDTLDEEDVVPIAIFDLECWDLSAEFAPLLCGSILSFPSGKMTTFRNDFYVKEGLAGSMMDDRMLLKAIRNALEAHGVLGGWYSKGFDIPLLKTRLMLSGERPLERRYHVDGIWACKGWRGIKVRNGKLASIARAFPQLGEQKMEVSAETWLSAREGNKEAMDAVVDRCESDVRITANAIKMLMNAGQIRNLEMYG